MRAVTTPSPPPQSPPNDSVSTEPETISPGSEEQVPPSQASAGVEEESVPGTPTTPPPHHPLLRKALVPLYKGRALTEDSSSGENRFIDNAAIFVGRLVKTLETKNSLFGRFERYGKIVSDQLWGAIDF